MSEWISVKDRLPEKGDRCLICINFGSTFIEPSVHDAQFTGSTFRRGRAKVPVSGVSDDDTVVTHWMPLPDLPEKDQ